MPVVNTPRLAILGAGPVGLEAALYARRLDLPVTVYERGRVGEHLRRWGHVRLFSPFGQNVTPLGRAAILADNPGHAFPADGDLTTGFDHLISYLEPLSGSTLLRDSVRPGVQAVQVGRRGGLKGDTPGDGRRAARPFRLLLRDAKGREEIAEADAVLDCTGTYGQHRWLGDGGIPAPGETAAAPYITYGLDDILGERQAHYAGKSVLVAGAGYSAATSVCRLASLAEKNPATWVVWLARGANSQPLRRHAADPLKERDRLAARANTLATRGEGHVEFHAHTAVESLEWLGADKGFRVATRRGSQARTFEVERVIANVGSTPDGGLYRELHVPECHVTLAPTTPAAGPNAPRDTEPNFYVLGAKSYGRNSHFLLRAGFEQVRDAFALITGKADLDLYKKR